MPHGLGGKRRSLFPDRRQAARWILPGTAISVQRPRIDAGLIYVGDIFPGPTGDREPSLIRPGLTIDGDATPPPAHSQIYATTYRDLTPAERDAYLAWLAGGRQDTDVPATFVALFLYGLERRVTVDLQVDPTIANEFPVIRDTVKRLLAQQADGMFTVGYAISHVLILVKLPPVSLDPEPMNAKPFGRSRYDDDTALRIFLGHQAVNGRPTPANVAYAWARVLPTSTQRVAADRCPKEFAKLFEVRYREAHGEGLTPLPPGHPVEVGYSAANPLLS